jgi:hypothetical protein
LLSSLHFSKLKGFTMKKVFVPVVLLLGALATGAQAQALKTDDDKTLYALACWWEKASGRST